MHGDLKEHLRVKKIGEKVKCLASNSRWAGFLFGLASSDKVSQLYVELVLSVHGSVFSGCKDKINELTSRHEEKVGGVFYLF